MQTAVETRAIAMNKSVLNTVWKTERQMDNVNLTATMKLVIEMTEIVHPLIVRMVV